MVPIPPIPPIIPKGLDDLVRSEFEAFRDGWFNWLLFWTAIVAVGLLFELPEIWHDTVDAIRALLDKPKGPEIAPWMKLLVSIGWLLIVVGVSGEFVADSFVSKADGIVQTFDEILVADAQRQTELAKIRAGGAYVRAAQLTKDAEAEKTIRQQLEGKITAAERRVEELRKNNNEAEARMEGEKQKRLKLALRMLPRRVFWDQSGAIHALSEFTKMEVIFEYEQEGDEELLAEQINFVVGHSLGWITWHRPPTFSLPGDDALGVRIFTGRKPLPKPPLRLPANESVAGILRLYLQKGGVATQIGDRFGSGPELPSDTILIRVGLKPTVRIEDIMAELGESLMPVNGVEMYGNAAPIPDKPPKRPITAPK